MTGFMLAPAVSGFIIPLTCPACGGDVTPQADGRPNAAGTTTAAVCRCSECRRGWVVHVNLLAADVATDTRTDKPIESRTKGVVAMVACKVCGVAMPKYRRAGRGGNPRLTCGPECASANWSAQSKARDAARCLHPPSSMVSA